MNQFRDALLSACNDNNVLLISHTGPDDDSIGSMLAAKHFLEKLTTADVTAAYEDRPPQRYETFDGFNALTFTDDLQSLVDDADLVVFLDGSELDRFSQEALDISVPTYCIDHHPCEDPVFAEHLINPEKTSTAEILYDLFADELGEETSRYLLLGLIGDTGNFRYLDAQQAYVFSIVQDLVETGDIDMEAFKDSWGQTQREEFEVFSQLMGAAKIIDDSGWPTYCYSTFDDTENFADADISGGAHMFVSWVRGVKGVEWSFVLTARSTGLTACSLRSSGVNVRHIVEGLDVGSGHDRAAGARFEVKPARAAEMIQDWIANNTPEYH